VKIRDYSNIIATTTGNVVNTSSRTLEYLETFGAPALRDLPGNYASTKHFSAPFTKGKWANYAEGFSTIDADGNGILWLGLKRLASLSKGNKLQLMIKVTWAESQDNVEANSVSWAIWRDFGVGDADGFPLRVGPMIGYSANLPSHPWRVPGISLDGEKFDPLAFHQNMNFSTPDRDNDQESSFSCAEQYASGWWYNRCAYLDLNRDPPAWFDGKNVHFAKETKMAFRLDD